jgi:CRISPR/Cas system-associated exonuclease Cas4 (RecB family)
MYMRCPRKYYLRYIKGMKQKPNIHLIRGKAVHDAIARYSQFELRSRGPPEIIEDDLIKFFKEAWNHQGAEIKKLGLKEKAVNEFYQESIKMLVGWFERVRANSREGRGLETEVKLFSKTHGIMGIIDAISRKDGKVSLIDYKTGKWDEITHELRVQMAIYALLYKENYGQLPDTIVLDFLGIQKAIRFKVTDEYSHYAATLCQDIHQMTSSADEKDYPCKCGGWCIKDFV